VKNPAFYAPDLKLVAAGCDMTKYRSMIDSIREYHAELTAQLTRQLLERELTDDDRKRILDRSLDAMRSSEERG
jgi:hypothetical protein